MSGVPVIMSWCPGHGSPCDPCGQCQAYPAIFNKMRNYSSAGILYGEWDVHLPHAPAACNPIVIIPDKFLSVNWPPLPPGSIVPNIPVIISATFNGTQFYQKTIKILYGTNPIPVGANIIYNGPPAFGIIDQFVGVYIDFPFGPYTATLIPPANLLFYA